MKTFDICYLSRQRVTFAVMASTPAPMKKFFGFVDENKERFIDNLAEAVAIKSVSAWPEAREAS